MALTGEWPLSVRSASRSVNDGLVSLRARFEIQDFTNPVGFLLRRFVSSVKTPVAGKFADGRSPETQLKCFLHECILGLRFLGAQVLFGYQWEVI